MAPTLDDRFVGMTHSSSFKLQLSNQPITEGEETNNQLLDPEHSVRTVKPQTTLHATL